MSRLLTGLGVAAILVLSMAFAALNGGQRVTLRLGFVTIYRMPLTMVAFGSLILGMLVMLVASIHSDLKVRRILRDRLAEEDEAERARMFVDRAQQDLFDGEGGPGTPSGRGADGPPRPQGLEAGRTPPRDVVEAREPSSPRAREVDLPKQPPDPPPAAPERRTSEPEEEPPPDPA